jgi:hypothetical protein
VLEGVVDALAASAPRALKASIAKGFNIAKRVVLWPRTPGPSRRTRA